MQVIILISGMVFVSQGFAIGSDGYSAVTACVATVIVVSTSSFVVFVAFEVYRAVKFAALHERTRELELQRIEQSIHNGRHTKRRKGGAHGMSAERCHPAQYTDVF